MSRISGCFSVATWDSKALIKVEGYATLNNSLFFKEFVEEMLNQGYQNFIVDLSLCKGMDSTFMGVLVGITHPEKNDRITNFPTITLININDYHQNLLDNLGISAVLTIKKEPIDLPDLSMKCLKESVCDPKERLLLIRKAHQRLVALNDKNKELFQEFLNMLERELQQEKSLQFPTS